MSQAASSNTDVRIFFANVAEITSFFKHSTQQMQYPERLPSTSATRWNDHSRSVMTIYENKDMFNECFERIEENSHQTNTINQAQGLKLKMEQSNFNFWMEFFYKVMPHVNILYDSLQSRNVTPDLAKKCVDSFLEEIKQIRIILDSMDVQETESERNRPKRTKRDPVPKTIAAKEVCGVISIQALDRFQFNGHLILAKLFNFYSFPVFQRKFSTD